MSGALGCSGTCVIDDVARRLLTLNASLVCANVLLERVGVHVEWVPNTWATEPPNKNNMDSSERN